MRISYMRMHIDILKNCAFYSKLYMRYVHLYTRQNDARIMYLLKWERGATALLFQHPVESFKFHFTLRCGEVCIYTGTPIWCIFQIACLPFDYMTFLLKLVAFKYIYKLHSIFQCYAKIPILKYTHF